MDCPRQLSPDVTLRYQITVGLMRMNEGAALAYNYSYEELRFIIDGSVDTTDGTGAKVTASAGDVVYSPKGTRATFKTSTTALGFYCTLIFRAFVPVVALCKESRT